MSKAQHKKQFFLLSLGCSKNTVDSNSMADLLLRAGFDAADDPDDASVLIVNTGRNNPGGVATATATRPPLPATMDEVRLKLDVLERTWMEVTVDSSVVFSGIAKANDTFEWTAQQEAKIVVGNAIGVFATVNDVALGRLGGRGESHEEVWRTTQATQ